MVAIQYSAVFIQLLLSLVSAAPINTELSADAVQNTGSDAIMQNPEGSEIETAADSAENQLDIKQNFCTGGSDCNGCCNDCGGCPEKGDCCCEPPCPCDIASQLKKAAKAALCPPPCPCDLLNKPCCCEKVDKPACNECGKTKCECPKPACNECGKAECCCKPPCPCDVGKCICDKLSCDKCGQKDCSC